LTTDGSLEGAAPALAVPDGQLFRSLVDALDDAVTVVACGPAGWRVVHANPAFACLSGHAPGEVLGSAPELADGLGQADALAVRRALDAGTPLRLAVVGRRKDGAPLRMRLGVDPLPAADGRRHALIVRRRAEAPAHAQALFEEIVESFREGVLLYGPDDRVLACNSALCGMFPHFGSRAEVVGRSFDELVRRQAALGSRDDAEVQRDPEGWIAARTARHAAPDGEALERRLPDGRIVQIFERRLPNGCTVAVHTDVTGVRRAENLLRDAIESMGEGFALYDRDDRLLMMNQRYREIWRPALDDLEFGAHFRAVLERSWAHGQMHEPGTDRETWIARRMARRRLAPHSLDRQLAPDRWVRITETRTHDGGTVTIATDISESRRQEAALLGRELELTNYVGQLEATEVRLRERTDALAALAESYAQEKTRAEAASAAKTLFLANVSHELRTPLNAIIGFSDILVNRIFGALGNPRYEDYARDIHRSGRHLLELINDLLDLSRIEAGRLDLSDDEVDLLEIADSARMMVAGRAERNEVTVLLLLGRPIPRLVADRRAVRQMLTNLLSNAVKFTQSGGRVEVRLERSEAGLAIVVRDTGVGIPADMLSRVAEPFTQVDADPERRHEGTGLGLALTKALIEAHGGRLRLESELGEGTTVSLLFPTARVKPS